ncbi:serine protein kinase RIO [Desertimonas flava]|jgi:RIO kinase 1|uniref:serine protein kinase RIO n=1 Tax=Desertimonas flava TaxID=2064846 RepID=UPI000E341576|nr:RIO1 family regulatory kinase/ATPase [Desertimonas flava]
MPRFRFDRRHDLDTDDFDDIDAVRRHPAPSRRRSHPRVADDDPTPLLIAPGAVTDESFADDRLPAGATLSTYPESDHGPRPVPGWVITSGDAFDVELGVVKTGKEADVDLVQRVDMATGRTVLLAAKRYRSAQHRMFHRDAGYLEGRAVRRSREMRAMGNRTEFGRQLIAGQWAAAEFSMLGRLWSAGVPVPYPVQMSGTELLLEFIGDVATRTAAPRLAETPRDRDAARDLWQQCVAAVLALGAAGYTHGDLSPYNVLVHDGRLVLIDLPQVVDLFGNPQGLEFLARDCRNICTWFASRGVDADAEQLTRDVIDAASP